MSALPPIFDYERKSYPLALIDSSGKVAFTVDIQDTEGKIFTATTVSSIKEFMRVSQDVDRDYRISAEDNAQSLSCFRGIALDPNFTRSQFFAIYDGSSCIGIATLIAIPYKNRTSDICLKRIGDKLIAQPFSELLHTHPVSFVIEIAMMKILLPYRHKKLGEAVVRYVLFPIIENLCSKSREEIAIKVTVYNVLPKLIKDIITPVFKEAVTSSPREISLSREMETYLGQICPESIFTSHQAMSHLSLVPEVFSQCLGPVYAKIVTDSSCLKY